MHVGDATPLGTDEDFANAYDATRLLLPRKLHAAMQLKLSELRAESVFAELRGYTEARGGSSYTRPMGGVLALLGRPVPKVWGDVREQLTRALLGEMLELDLEDYSSAELGRRWAASQRATSARSASRRSSQ